MRFWRPSLPTRRAVATLVGLVIVIPAAASAEREDELDRWVPSLSAYSGVIGQGAEASIMSSLTPTLMGPTPVREPVSGSDVIWSPFVGGNLELMTPSLRVIPGSPRIFLRGGAASTFGFNRDVTKEGSPGQMMFPNLAFGQPIFDLDERQVPGQGSSVSAKVRSLEISAGGGVAFTFEVGERRVRIKPSFEYLRTEIELTGQARRAVVFDPGSRGPPQEPTVFRFLPIDAEDKLTVHGVGGGLELEADAGRAGPFVFSLYLSGQAYKAFGDTDSTFTGVYTDIFGSQSSTFDFELDPWFYRGGVGLRFRFLPEDDDWWRLR